MYIEIIQQVIFNEMSRTMAQKTKSCSSNYSVVSKIIENRLFLISDQSICKITMIGVLQPYDLCRHQAVVV